MAETRVHPLHVSFVSLDGEAPSNGLLDAPCQAGPLDAKHRNPRQRPPSSSPRGVGLPASVILGSKRTNPFPPLSAYRLSFPALSFPPTFALPSIYIALPPPLPFPSVALPPLLPFLGRLL